MSRQHGLISPSELFSQLLPVVLSKTQWLRGESRGRGQEKGDKQKQKTLHGVFIPTFPSVDACALKQVFMGMAAINVHITQPRIDHQRGMSWR
jgi:hypothetical protein